MEAQRHRDTGRDRWGKERDTERQRGEKDSEKQRWRDLEREKQRQKR